MYEYEWSHEPILAFVNSGETLSYAIFVERIDNDPITELEVSREKMEVIYEPIIDDDQGLEEFPDSITVTVSNNEVGISGQIEAQADFIDKAYSVDGESRQVETIQDIPFGAKVHKLIPTSDEYKYYKWRIYTVDKVNDAPTAERSFTLTVRISWDEANKTIIKLASEIKR